MAGVYRAAGFGLWQTRLSLLIVGALGVVAVALFTRRLTGSALAGVIAGLVLTVIVIIVAPMIAG